MEREAYLHIGDPTDPKTWLVQVKEKVGGGLKVTPAQLARALVTFKEDMASLTSAVAIQLRRKLGSLFRSTGCNVPNALLEQEGQELIEKATVFDDSLKVDRDAGMIRGLRLMNPKSSNGYTYSAQALADVARLAEGRPCFLNHADTNKRNIGDLAGKFENVRVVTSPPGVVGDLMLIGPTFRNDQLLTIAEKAPSSAALSIHARGRLDQAKQLVEKVASVSSVDVVAFGATTDGLFESEGWTSEAYVGLTAEEVLKRCPDVAVDIYNKLLTEKDSTMADNEKLERELRESKAREVTLIEERDKAKSVLQEKEEAEKRRTLAATVLKEHGPAEKLPALYKAKLVEELVKHPDRKAMEGVIDDRVQLFEAAKLVGKGDPLNPETEPPGAGEPGAKGKATDADVREMMGRDPEPAKD